MSPLSSQLDSSHLSELSGLLCDRGLSLSYTLEEGTAA